MASLSQSSWFSCLHDISTIRSPKAKRVPQTPSILPANPKSFSFKTLKRSSFALGSLSDEFSPSNSSDNPEVREEPKSERVKLAFERAKEYKKSLRFDQVGDIGEGPVGESPDIVSASGGLVSDNEDGGLKEVSEAGNGRRNEESDNLPGDGDGEKDVPEAVRIAMMKAKEYQKNKGTMGTSNVDDILLPVDVDSEKEVPAAVRIAVEKAKEYKENKGNVSDNGRNEGGEQLPAHDKIQFLTMSVVQKRTSQKLSGLQWRKPKSIRRTRVP